MAASCFDCVYLNQGLFFPSSGCALGDGLPYARFTESWGIRFTSPDPTWALSTSGPFLAGYVSSGVNYGAGNILASGCISIGTTGTKMPLTFKDALGGKILLNDNQNNYSIALASGIVSADASMKFTSGCMTPGDTTFYRGTTLSMIITCTGNMGIGTAAPTSKLDICGADGKIQSRVDSSDGSTINVRPNAGKCGWISYTEDAVADRWGIGVKNGDAKLYFASGNVGSGGGTTRMIIDGGGCVGINTTSPTYRLHVNGTFYAAGSSQDYKQSICNYNTDSCMFMKLKPVTYQYKEEYCHLGKELKSGTQIGLIAEEVAESHPELAILVNEEDEKVVRNVDYEKLTIILLSELQKLRQEVDQLKNK